MILKLTSRYLRRRLELLSDQMADIHKRRSVSESSTSTVSSIQSSNSESGQSMISNPVMTLWMMWKMWTVTLWMWRMRCS